jgi:hypothetical protein
MLISEADIGDEVSWTNSKSGFIESFVIVGKCIDFYWDGNLIGDVFIQLNGPTNPAGEAWPSSSARSALSLSPTRARFHPLPVSAPCLC